LGLNNKLLKGRYGGEQLFIGHNLQIVGRELRGWEGGRSKKDKKKFKKKFKKSSKKSSKKGQIKVRQKGSNHSIAEYCIMAEVRKKFKKKVQKKVQKKFEKKVRKKV
jgi:hypothetical protein